MTWSTFDTAAEQRALHNVTITSDTNRAVRLGLGAVYTYAAAAFAWHMLAPRSDGGAALSSRVAGASSLSEMSGALAQLALIWLGCFADLRVAGVWGSSGFCGQ